MDIAAYLRHGLTVVFCPRCQLIRELATGVPVVGADWSDAKCGICFGALEVVRPADGSALATAK